ncbi:uncharacterized protein [Pseudorasbora parva]|uniref:uncharacterized protein n=1 Tax=Pseudorasbora parva TaxID=51549 RepID=UPI00351F0A9A
MDSPNFRRFSTQRSGHTRDTWPGCHTDSPQVGQSILEPGADCDLIDLWSADPIPTQVPTLESSSSSAVLSGYLLSESLPVFLIPSPSLVTASPLDPSAPLVLSSSSAVPPLHIPCSSSSVPWAFLPRARIEAKSPATPRAFRTISPPQHVSPSPLPQLNGPSSPPRLVCLKTLSFVTPCWPLAVDTASGRTSGICAASSPCTPTVSICSSLPPAPVGAPVL